MAQGGVFVPRYVVQIYGWTKTEDGCLSGNDLEKEKQKALFVRLRGFFASDHFFNGLENVFGQGKIGFRKIGQDGVDRIGRVGSRSFAEEDVIGGEIVLIADFVERVGGHPLFAVLDFRQELGGNADFFRELLACVPELFTRTSDSRSDLFRQVFFQMDILPHSILVIAMSVLHKL